MAKESAVAINYKKLREEELERKGYNTQDVGILSSLKLLEEYPELLSRYLESYIHNKVMYENQSKKLKESISKWWSEHKDDVDTGRHEEYKIYDEVPEFVIEAMRLR